MRLSGPVLVEVFYDLDQNSDLVLDQSETSQLLPHLLKDLLVLDSDNDGLISKSEVVSRVREDTEKQFGWMFQQFKRRMDWDHDGTISSDDVIQAGLPSPIVSFLADVDKNQDGLLDRSEESAMIPNFRRISFRMQIQGLMALYETPLPDPKQAHSKERFLLFLADSDGNGRISDEELKAGLEVFIGAEATPLVPTDAPTPGIPPSPSQASGQPVPHSPKLLPETPTPMKNPVQPATGAASEPIQVKTPSTPGSAISLDTKKEPTMKPSPKLLPKTTTPLGNPAQPDFRTASDPVQVRTPSTPGSAISLETKKEPKEPKESKEPVRASPDKTQPIAKPTPSGLPARKSFILSTPGANEKPVEDSEGELFKMITEGYENSNSW
jgi:Ca2+-binding EF-hand superfamily protein